MTKAEVTYPDFSAGEISPRMWGRFDAKLYFNSARRVENFIPQIAGPAHYRTGFFYAAETAGNNKAFLHLFKYTDSLSFILEFTDQKLRFFRNNGIVESGGSPVEVVTPYLEAELFELKFAQKGVDLYIVHPNHNPRKLTYTSPTSWALTTHSPTGLTLGSGDYPRAVAFYEQRLVYGGSDNNPQTVWMSKSADTDDFTIGTGADDGIQYTLSGDGNFIRWILGTDRFMAIGTFSDILKATGGLEDVITPTSISIKSSNAVGCADISPIGRNNDIYFVRRDKRALCSFEYEFERDSYVAVDRNTISDHITIGGFNQVCFQAARPTIIWAPRGDGVLPGLTFERQEKVSGWHRTTTDGEVISAMTTPRDTKTDQLWVCVKRTINGSEKYFIEYLVDEPVHPSRCCYVSGSKSDDDDRWANDTYETMKEYVHVDSAATYDGTQPGLDASATMTPGATTGTGVTFTASAAVFSSSDVGRQIWRKSMTGEEYGRAEITGYTSSTVVTCDILEDFDSADAIAAGEWYLTADELTGLSHLEGKTVSIVADGGQHSQEIVSSGAVSLDSQASVVHVGLPYIGYLETNDLEGGGTTGAAQTKRKKIYKFGIRFWNTLFAKFGAGYYNLTQVYQRTASMKMDRPPLLFSGDLAETFANQINDDIDAGWTRGKRAIIVQDQPFPCNVQLIMPYMETSN